MIAQSEIPEKIAEAKSLLDEANQLVAQSSYRAAYDKLVEVNRVVDQVAVGCGIVHARPGPMRSARL